MAVSTQQDALITLYRGDSHSVQISVLEEDPDTRVKSAMDVSGATCLLAVRRKVADAAPLLAKAGTVVDGPNGRIGFGLAPADTSGIKEGVYLFDVSVTLPGGDHYTVASGNFQILAIVHDPP